jgi:hypothetical protein
MTQNKSVIDSCVTLSISILKSGENGFGENILNTKSKIKIFNLDHIKHLIFLINR